MGICVSCRRRERKAPEKRSGAGLGAGGPGKGPAAAELLPRRVEHLPAMANSISNIKMTNPIKGIVSKRRKRYIKDGFNLDLAYITDRLIAMGFPAEKLEGVYRNHIDEVSRFLEQMHKDHYKIYNLCSERSYDSSKFHERVERYAFEDHTPPNMELIQPFCEDVHSWLSADARNVAAVHCKAGKGRTGTMVCCYLLYSGQKATADEALQFYGTKRTHDEKGVTIPSQRRYVEYYAELVRSGLQYTATKVYIRELVMCPPPMLNGGQCTLELTVSQAQPPFKAPHGCHEVRKHARCVRVCLTHCTPLHGDVRVDVYNKPKMMMRKEKLFHFWFNTFFLVCGVGAQRIPPPPDSPNQETYKLTLNKWQLDDAHKDKQHKLYSPDFKVELIVQKQPDTSTFSAHPPRAPSPPSSSASSASEPDTEPDSHWDSGERPAPCRYRAPLAPRPRAPPSYAPRRPVRHPPADCAPATPSCKTVQACSDVRPHRLTRCASPTCRYRLRDPDATRPADLDSPDTTCDKTGILPHGDSGVDLEAFQCSDRTRKACECSSRYPFDTHPYDLASDNEYGLTADVPNRENTDPVLPYKMLSDSGTDVEFDSHPTDPDRFGLRPDRASGDRYELLPDREYPDYLSSDRPERPSLAWKFKESPYDLLPGDGHEQSLAFKLLPDMEPEYLLPDGPDKDLPESYDLLPDKEEPDDPPPAYKLLPDKSRSFNKARLSLTDVRASWKEFSGKFSEHRRKRDKE